MPPQTRSSVKRSTRFATRQKPGKASVPQTKAAAQTSSKSAPAKAKSDKQTQPPRKRARRATPEPEPEPEVAPPKRIRARIAKPLTERVWEAALPSLIAWLERNRERRLENEKSQRRWRRQTKIINWMNLLRRDSDPFARAFGPSSSGDPDPSHVLASDPSDANMSLFLGPPTMWDMRRLKRAFPASHQMIRWPIFETMMGQDVSIEELDQTLEQSKPAVDKLISEWTQELEQTLVSLLPEEPSSSKDTSNSGDGTATQIACPIPEYTCAQGDGSQMRPLTELPMDTQRLLRADSVFMRGHTVNFYPADFHGSYFDVKDMTHDPSIAKALLASLGLSDATFLQLQAAGRPFVCGRCNNSDRMTWKDA
ncbi:hypothetical protein FRC12_002249, partial [Ceratobasidium sp. 428]